MSTVASLVGPQVSAEELGVSAEEPHSSTVAYEDWIAVATGAAIILLVTLGVRPDVPRLSWSAAGDLSATVLTAANFSRWIQLGLLLLIPAAAGARMMGAPMVAFLGARAVNIAVTLAFAYLLFGGMLFPVRTFN